MVPPTKESSSDDLSGISNFDDSSDEDSAHAMDDEDDVDEVAPTVGDYVLVGFAGKSKGYYYIGVVTKVDGDEFEVKFMRKCCTDSNEGDLTFTFKTTDECSFPKEDVSRKLPLPFTVGGTARRELRFIFPYNLDNWQIG